jgi:hypothetical protein
MNRICPSMSGKLPDSNQALQKEIEVPTSHASSCCAELNKGSSMRLTSCARLMEARVTSSNSSSSSSSSSRRPRRSSPCRCRCTRCSSRCLLSRPMSRHQASHPTPTFSRSSTCTWAPSRSSSRCFLYPTQTKSVTNQLHTTKRSIMPDLLGFVRIYPTRHVKEPDLMYDGGAQVVTAPQQQHYTQPVLQMVQPTTTQQVRSTSKPATLILIPAHDDCRWSRIACFA